MFFNEKLDRCAEALDGLTPAQKAKVEAFVSQFGPLHARKSTDEINIVARVDVSSSSSSHSSSSGDDDEDLPESIAQEMHEEVQENRKRVLSWLTGHRALYGKSHSHEQQEDAWE